MFPLRNQEKYQFFFFVKKYLIWLNCFCYYIFRLTVKDSDGSINSTTANVTAIKGKVSLFNI